jgi:hypothetical protein
MPMSGVFIDLASVVPDVDDTRANIWMNRASGVADTFICFTCFVFCADGQWLLRTTSLAVRTASSQLIDRIVQLICHTTCCNTNTQLFLCSYTALPVSFMLSGSFSTRTSFTPEHVSNTFSRPRGHEAFSLLHHYCRFALYPALPSTSCRRPPYRNRTSWSCTLMPSCRDEPPARARRRFFHAAELAANGGVQSHPGEVWSSTGQLTSAPAPFKQNCRSVP